MTIRSIPIEKVRPNPFCPRSTKGESMSKEVIAEFAAEIDELGWWGTALKARKVDDHHEIAFGRRRLAALKKLGKKTVDLEVEDLDDTQMKMLTATENFQRHGLTDEERVEVWRQIYGVCGDNMEKARAILGISKPTAQAYCDVLAYEKRKPGAKKIAKDISPRTVTEAKRLGALLSSEGADDMIETTRRRAGKEFGANVIRNIHTKIVEIAKDNARLKQDLVREAIAGRIKNDDAVEPAARRIRQRRFDEKIKAAKEKAGPPDLLEVIAGWVNELPEIIEKIAFIARSKEYAEYIVEGDPVLASQFKKLLRELVTAAHKLEDNIVPRLR